MTQSEFTPALGRFKSTKLFDAVIALTRERLWRSLLVMHAAPRPGESIVDVGCGTGTLALLLHRVEPTARILGVDPDPAVLALARRKAAAAPIRWHNGSGDALAEAVDAEVDLVVSSLVLHQCPLPVKRAILASMFAVLKPGGRLVIADFGRQRTWLMRQFYRIVQLADGKADTQPNAEGVLPKLMTEVGFTAVREAEVVDTVNGSISVYVARRSGDPAPAAPPPGSAPSSPASDG